MCFFLFLSHLVSWTGVLLNYFLNESYHAKGWGGGGGGECNHGPYQSVNKCSVAKAFVFVIRFLRVSTYCVRTTKALIRLRACAV